MILNINGIQNIPGIYVTTNFKFVKPIILLSVIWEQSEYIQQFGIGDISYETKMFAVTHFKSCLYSKVIIIVIVIIKHENM